jgi:hypothetical protein
VLTEIADWTVHGVAGNQTVRVYCEQMHLEDAVQRAWTYFRSEHPGVDPASWVLRCVSSGDAPSVVVLKPVDEGRAFLQYDVLEGDSDGG